MTHLHHVPVLDMALWRQGPEGQAEFARQFADAFQNIGFAHVDNHGMSRDVCGRAYSATENLAGYSDAAWKVYEDKTSGRATGPTLFGIEQAADATVPDEKRFWHVERPLPDDHLAYTAGIAHRNIWPCEVPEFEPVMLAMFAEYDAVAHELLSALELGHGCLPGELTRLTMDGQSTLRTAIYPPVINLGAPRAGEHTDINLITLIYVFNQATASGLEMQTLDGEWLCVNARPGSILINAGDMLSMWCGYHRPHGQQIRSTNHRVVYDHQTARTWRYSLPFFHHPLGSTVLAVKDGVPYTAADYKRDRFKANKVLAT